MRERDVAMLAEVACQDNMLSRGEALQYDRLKVYQSCSALLNYYDLGRISSSLSRNS